MAFLCYYYLGIINDPLDDSKSQKSFLTWIPILNAPVVVPGWLKLTLIKLSTQQKTKSKIGSSPLLMKRIIFHIFILESFKHSTANHTLRRVSESIRRLIGMYFLILSLSVTAWDVWKVNVIISVGNNWD